MSLYDRLIEYTGSGLLPLHMPGHKRNSSISLPDAYQTDITELPGFDSLYDETGLLSDLTNRIENLYHCKKTFLLVNGSTGGVLTAIHAATRRGDTVLLARNCHTSVFHAIQLFDLHAEYLVPDYDNHGIAEGITLSLVRNKMENLRKKHIIPRLVILTSPTYEGILSELNEIIPYLHSCGIPLFVDEAHGAHLGFHPAFLGGAVEAGADLVVQSLHKTLPALTQTALLHVNSTLISTNQVTSSWKLLQTTSPSFLLLSSVDLCVQLLENDSSALFDKLFEQITAFTKSTAALDFLHVLSLPCEQKDPSRIVVLTSGMDITKQLSVDLRERYQIEVEYVAPTYLVAISGIADSPDALLRFSDALCSLDQDYQQKYLSVSTEQPDSTSVLHDLLSTLPEQCMDSSKAAVCPHNPLLIADTAGYISAEYLYLYPPGVPLLVPGEQIPETVPALLDRLNHTGFCIRGPEQANEHILRVISGNILPE